MTADAEAEGKVARRRGRLSRRRVSAHRAREHPEFGDNQGLNISASVPSESLLSTRQHGARRTSSVPGKSRGTADVRWCRSQPAAHIGFSALGAPRRGGDSRPALAPNPRRLPRHALAPARGAGAASTAHAEPRLVDRRGGVAAAAFASSASSDGRLSQVLVGDWHSAAFYYVPRLQPMRFR